MYQGWMRFDGVELMNAARTHAYAAANGLDFFSPVYDTTDLAQVLTELPEGQGGPYVDPATDGADWYDPNYPDTAKFLGFYLLQATNMQAGNIKRKVTENINRGGTATPIRVGSREMVFTGILLGTDLDGAREGLTWLKTLLEKGDVCDVAPDNGWCGRQQIDFFQQRLDAGTPSPDVYYPQMRTITGVQLLEGPEILTPVDRQDAECGAFIQVEFTMVAENPYIYGWPTTVDTTWVAAEDVTYADVLAQATSDYDTLLNTDIPGGCGGSCPNTYIGLVEWIWSIEVGTTLPGAGTEPDPYDPGVFQDPYCAPPASWPGAPQEDLVCRDYTDGPWQRYVWTIEPSDTSKWAEHVPTITLENTSTTHHKDIVFRFAPPGALPDSGATEELYVTSLPGESTMILCGVRDEIVLQKGQYEASAEHLVFSEVSPVDVRAVPFRFPVLECGGAWTMTMDLPSDAVNTELDVNLRLVSREA